MINADETSVPSVNQLMLLRSLVSRDVEAGLLPNLASRCGAAEAELDELRRLGLIRVRRGRAALTPEGRAFYRRESKGRWF